MVEESMDSLGIDSHCLDIRVTAGREEEKSTTKLLATSWKGKDHLSYISTGPDIRIANERPEDWITKALPAGLTAVWPSFSWK